MKRLFHLSAAVASVLLVACNSGTTQNDAQADTATQQNKLQANIDTNAGPANVSQPFIKLPKGYNTPDGLAITGDNSVILSVPNFNNEYLLKQGLIKSPDAPFMAIIGTDNKIAHWYDFKPQDMHPETGHVGPMDSAIGPDGNLYVADMQVFFNKDHKSRILRINIVNGKAVSADVVVEGFIASNGVYWQGDHLFVTESVLQAGNKSLVSGVYAIALKEMQDKSPVHLKPYQNGRGDDHLVVTFQSDNHMGFGADGITFDDKGYMYTTVIEKGQIFRSKLDSRNKAVETTLFAQDKHMKGPDGLIFSPERNTFYVADFLNNAVHAISRDGKVTTLQMNGDTDGTDGKLDQPAEILLRGHELLIVNMDMAWATPKLSVNTKVDTAYNLSKINL
ncbi:SMP-30/gluconolactonase/LRE family protein [Mucilaginibacter sp. CAU 1740]|uniref:SMP-30/gluconolactonase/LRE family protein n=1 Tax=Mucilaginibacter sp. CAU 1740 TaxID=3140365 RepID=UPI00325A8A92